MRDEDIRFLDSPEGRDLLNQLTPDDITPAATLNTASRLRDEVGPQRAHALLETATLRLRAANKFTRADQMLFTREALEQSTGEEVARYRAAKFAARGYGLVADLGCGIGGDALALAETSFVVGVEREILRLRLAQHNLGVYGHTERFLPVCADLEQIAPMPVEAFFIDPARRTPSDSRTAPSRRLKSILTYRPSWSTIEAWLARVPHAAVKVSPGIDYAEVPANAGLEFVSLRGEVKEGIFWFGDLQQSAKRRATLLPTGDTLTTNGNEPIIDVSPPLGYLYEPDGAVIRAHLVRTLSAQLGAKLLDESIAYLTSDTWQPTPFARAYHIEAAFPFQLKRLRHYLREHHVGDVIVKKRGSPLDPDDLRRALRLTGYEHRIVFLTQVLNKPYVLIGQAV